MVVAGRDERTNTKLIFLTRVAWVSAIVHPHKAKRRGRNPRRQQTSGDESAYQPLVTSGGA
jgi:hypothetical protein